MPDPSTRPAPSVLDSLLRTDFASFVRASFFELAPGLELKWAPYLDVVCDRLAAVAAGDCRRLIITLPPRHMKSICVSVALPAFVLGHNPRSQIMAVSYGQELANSLAQDTRTVMLSPFYQRIFETRLASPRQALKLLKTTEGGLRRATSTMGVATGVGSDLLIFDDPQKPVDALSLAVRTAVNQTYSNTFHSRANDPLKNRIVVVMQRLHEDDFVGHLLGLPGNWEVLNFPAIAEADERHRFKAGGGRLVTTRKEGDALNPARMPLGVLNETRLTIGEAQWASQYQQRPAPAGGGMVKEAWFRRFSPSDVPEHWDSVFQSWDTANTMAEWSAFSVCTTWGVRGKSVYLLDVYRARLLYPDLKQKVVELAARFSASRIIIEDNASGTPLIQDLRRDNQRGVEAFKPDGDKEMRMAAQAALIEQGAVFIPKEAPWLAEFLHELVMFPNAKYRDQVDSTSQALRCWSAPPVKGAAYLEIAREYNRANGAG